LRAAKACRSANPSSSAKRGTCSSIFVRLRSLPASPRPLHQEGPKADDVIRELAVASHAASHGAPVVAPSNDVAPGPHFHDGHVVTFWRYVESVGEPDDAAAGRGLHRIHEALADYDGALPTANRDEDIREMFTTLGETEDVAFLRRVVSTVPELEGQALHGDAHLHNCLETRSGPLWHDFETACRGPREYDLAALVLRDLCVGADEPARTALRAYGDYDEELLEICVPAYAVWIYASSLTALPRRPELVPIVRERLEWLRRYVDASS
jgi:hypothetical protein